MHVPLPRSNDMMRAKSTQADYAACVSLNLGPNSKQIEVLREWIPRANEYFRKLRNEDLVNILTRQWHGNQIYALALELFQLDFHHEHVRFGGHKFVTTDSNGLPNNVGFYHIISKRLGVMEWILYEPQIRAKLNDYSSTSRALIETVISEHHTIQFWKDVVQLWNVAFSNLIRKSPRLQTSITLYYGEPLNENIPPFETYAHNQVTGFTIDPATALLYSRQSNKSGKRQLWRIQVHESIPVFCACGLVPPVRGYALIECWVLPGNKLIVDKRTDSSYAEETANGGYVQREIQIVDAHYVLDKSQQKNQKKSKRAEQKKSKLAFLV